MLEIVGADRRSTIGETAAANAIVLHELTPLQASLEEAFMELTRDDVEYKAGSPTTAGDREEVAA